jgi:hypothetical protein
MKIFTEFLNEASFEFGGKTYFAGWGKYRCDGEEITRDEYMKARQAYDKKDVNVSSNSRITKSIKLNPMQKKMWDYAHNDEIFRRREKAIQNKLIDNIKNNTYNSEDAVNRWYTWSGAVLNGYQDEYGYDDEISRNFTENDRKMLALLKAKEFETRYKNGDFK